MDIQIHRQSGIYTLVAKQHLRTSLDAAWAFFATPANLDRITPADMQFQITSAPTEQMYAGQIIQYQIGIFPGVKSVWVTEITHIHDRKLFVDEQRIGPYRLWHHEHHFQETPDGVLMTDIVTYSLPVGWPGRLVAGRAIANRLQRIFAFRYREIEKLFGGFNS